MEFVLQLLDFSVLREELGLVFQVLGVLSWIIGLLRSQGRAVLRVSSVWSSFVNYWTVRFSGKSCASFFKCSEFVRRLLNCSVFRGSCATCFNCLEFVRRLLDCLVLKGDLCFVVQVFGARSSIIELFDSQGRAALRVLSVWSSFVD